MGSHAKGTQLTYKLNTGADIPAVALGTWKSEPGKMKEVIHAALEDAGYRHIDCAAAYGNQAEIGEALQEVFKGGKLKRDELFITSKLWGTHAQPPHVAQGLEQTLKELQVDYVDLYLIHWPITWHPDASSPAKPEDFRPVDMASTWKAMEELVESGKAKAIGVSNWSVKKLEDLLKTAKITPAANQIETHPAWRNQKIIDFCKSKSIQIEAYSPLGSDSIELSDPVAGDTTSLLHHTTVENIAKKMNKSTGQILIRWGLQRGYVVLPKSSNPDRLKQNLDVFDWELSSEDFEALCKLEPQKKAVTGKGMFAEVEGSPYKTLNDLWDGEI